MLVSCVPLRICVLAFVFHLLTNRVILVHGLSCCSVDKLVSCLQDDWLEYKFSLLRAAIVRGSWGEGGPGARTQAQAGGGDCRWTRRRLGRPRHLRSSREKRRREDNQGRESWEEARLVLNHNGTHFAAAATTRFSKPGDKLHTCLWFQRLFVFARNFDVPVFSEMR